MPWDVGNYQPGPQGQPFDFELLREGFERLRAGNDDEGEYVYWTCENCHATGKTKQAPYLCPVCGRPL